MLAASVIRPRPGGASVGGNEVSIVEHISIDLMTNLGGKGQQADAFGVSIGRDESKSGRLWFGNESFLGYIMMRLVFIVQK